MRPIPQKVYALALAGLAGLAGTVVDTSPALAQGPEYAGVVAQHSNKCLDVPHGNPVNHVVIQQYSCHGGPAQRWRFTHFGNGYYQIQSVLTGKCLNVPLSSAANALAVEQYSCQGSFNQQWAYDPTHGSLRARHSGKCLDVRNGGLGNGVVVQQYTCHGGRTQSWGLFPTVVV
jgi:hypothetical protein